MCNWFQNKSPTHTFAVDWDTWHGNWAAPCYFNGASPTGSARWGNCLQRHLACEGLYYIYQLFSTTINSCGQENSIHTNYKLINLRYARPNTMVHYILKSVCNTFIEHNYTLIARFMGPTWGPSGADRTQVGPMLAPWTLLFGIVKLTAVLIVSVYTVAICRLIP